MPTSLLTKAFSADVKVQDGERAVTAVISTDAVDRDGEVLIPQGCNWKEFNANPVVLFLHSYYSLPVGKVVALTRDADSITAKIVFADRPESHPTGQEWIPDTLLALFQQKVLNAFSVGFTVTESRPATDKDVTTFGAGVRRVISKWKLLELSVVPLPCNQEAVALAVSKGIVSPAMAKGVWGVEGKAEEPAMQTCPECKNEFHPDDMVDDDGRMVCKGCYDAMKAAKSAPAKLVYYIEPEVKAPAIDLVGIAAKAAAKAAGKLYYI
jgi:HK97 family phage prohead protease